MADVLHRNLDAQPERIRRDAQRQRAAGFSGAAAEPAISCESRGGQERDAVLLHAEQHGHRLPARAHLDPRAVSECGWERERARRFAAVYEWDGAAYEE